MVLAGIYDQEIKRLVLSADEMHKDIPDIIKTVELHERAFSMTATGGSATVAATTAYKAKGRPPQQPSQLNDSHGGGGSTPARGEVRCGCGNWFSRFATRNDGRQNKTAYTCCKACFLGERKRGKRDRKIAANSRESSRER